jgi:osmotically-inducible protein OsmY
MKAFLALIVGIGVGGVAVWFFTTHGNDPHVQAATNQIQSAAKSARDTVQDKLRVLDLRTNDIKDEFAKTGRVIRRKAGEAEQAIVNATADARITAAIKTKLVGDHDLSVWSISVNTTQGIVTLSGFVPSMEAISKAMMLAMETDGVKEVISTLQVKGKS